MNSLVPAVTRAIAHQLGRPASTRSTVRHQYQEVDSSLLAFFLARLRRSRVFAGVRAKTCGLRHPHRGLHSSLSSCVCPPGSPQDVPEVRKAPRTKRTNQRSRAHGSSSWIESVAWATAPSSTIRRSGSSSGRRVDRWFRAPPDPDAGSIPDSEIELPANSWGLTDGPRDPRHAA